MLRRLLLAGMCLALSAIPLLQGTADAAPVQEPGLVAYYPLDESSGDLAHDRSGHGNHGKIRGARWEESEQGCTLQFDGEDDHVFCANPAVLDIRGPFTLSAWVMPSEVPAGEVGIAGKQFTSYLLTYYRNGQAYGYVGDGGNNVRTPITTNVWNHLAGTFDGDRLRLYLNGQLVAERLSKYNDVPPGTSFVIGCVAGQADADDPNYRQSGFFPGAIAEVKVYRRALSGGEIRDQFVRLGKTRFAARPVEVSEVEAVASVAAGGIRVRAGRSGIVQVDARGGFFVLESSFSYPGEKIGTNRLGGQANDGEASWQPEVRAGADGGLTISARGAYYGLERTVKIAGERVEVEDRVTNLTDQPVGIVVRHKARTPGVFSISRLGTGSDDPFVFVGTPDYDLGILVEDDVARTQLQPFALMNEAGFHLPHFGLEAGKSYTFRWAVYPLAPTGDALAFINKVREDWGVNHTILGPCAFFDATSEIIGDPDRLEAYLRRRKLGIAMLSPWLDYDPGSMSYTMPREQYREMMTRAKQALKAADPEIQVIGSIETDWVAIYPDKIPGGERLPSHGGGPSGQVPTTPDQTRILREAGLPWNDSMKVDTEGNLRLELYGRGGKPQMALGVYPAEGNYQAEFLLEQGKFLTEEVGLDGFYIDEFSLFWVRSCDGWDGHTVDVDRRTGRIIRQYTHAGVAGIKPRLDLCNYAVDHGLVMVANTYATAVAESRLPVMRFAETWSTFDPLALPKTGKPPWMPSLARSQLGTPIGLGADGRDLTVGDARLLMRCIICYLRHGMVYYHYFFPDLPEEGEGSGEYGPINHMFPITPVRLFEGGVVGRERTITCVSGSYPWRHAQEPRVLVFGPDGRVKQGDFTIRKAADADAWDVELRLSDWNEIAVME